MAALTLHATTPADIPTLHRLMRDFADHERGVSREWGIMPRWPTARSGWYAAETGGPILSRAFHCRLRSEPEAGDRHLFGTSASAAVNGG